MQASRTNREVMEMLTVRSDFLRLQTQGKKWVAQGFILQVLDRQAQNTEDARIRIGYTVTKKIDKSAVRRNRIKRRLRAVAADILHDNAKRGADYVLIGRQTTDTRSYADLKRDLIWCLKRTDFYEKHEAGQA